MTVSLGSILSNARSGLAASQAAINTTSHNIANAQTEGYSRKRVDIRANTPQMMPYGSVGRGVVINDITRARDVLLDGTYRTQASDASEYGRRSELLSQIEGLYATGAAGDLAATLDSFWSSWSDLASQPMNDAARMTVRQAGEHLTNQLQRISTGLDQITAGADLRMRQDVGQLNQYASEVASLNRQIVADESGGKTAADLRDQRDRAIDAISALADVQVYERQDGSVAVIAGDATIVDGAASLALRVDTTGGTYSLETARGTSVGAPGGLIGAAMTVLNRDIPQAQAELDNMARALVTDVNAIHETGMNAAGDTGIAFFDDLGDVSTVTARTLTLSAAVRADHGAIAAGTGVDDGTGTLIYAAGRNDLALAIAGRRDAGSATLGGATVGDYYTSSVTRVGSDVRAARDGAAISETLASQADTRRMSVSGVSIDEELVNLIQFQNAYSAAARVITAVDEMFETVIGMMR
jgi:flagellar hook-associated protein 1